MITNAEAPSTGTIRSCFPALASSTAFLENAGGSQLPRSVIDAMTAYMAHTFVQLGADYPASRSATDTVHRAHDFMKVLVNAGETGEVVLASSTSILVHMLADAYARALDPRRDEIVVSTLGHEANVGPWLRLADRGYKVRPWGPAQDSHGDWRCTAESLAPLLGERTRLVAFPHVSNLLGDIEDVHGLTAMAHQAGARVVVDGVAFAPHRAIDVAAWGCDWYIFSNYKVYGPHMATMFGRRDAFAELKGPNHFFVADDDIPYKFELGGVNHEGCAGLLGLMPYLRMLDGSTGPAAAPTHIDRATVKRAFDRMTALELPLQQRLIDYLRSKPSVTLHGPARADASRVATISFTCRGQRSADVSRRVCERGVAIRHGSMYSVRLCEELGLDPQDGVVRVSLVHYNTLDEVDRLIAALDPILN